MKLVKRNHFIVKSSTKLIERLVLAMDKYSQQILVVNEFSNLKYEVALITNDKNETIDTKYFQNTIWYKYFVLPKGELFNFQPPKELGEKLTLQLV